MRCSNPGCNKFQPVSGIFTFVGVAPTVGIGIGVADGMGVNVGIGVVVGKSAWRTGSHPATTQHPSIKQMIIPIKDFDVFMVEVSQHRLGLPAKTNTFWAWIKLDLAEWNHVISTHAIQKSGEL